MKKSFVVIATIITAVTLSLSACDSSFENSDSLTQSSDVEDSKKVIETLNKAHDIRVKKEAFSIGDSWAVYADDEQIAEIKGEVFPVLGDTYSMYSNTGNLVGAETEDFLTLTHGSKTYDYMGEQRGHIKQKALTFGYDFDIYEKSKNVGNVRQKFSLGLQADIKDSDGNVEYNVDKEIFSFGSDITISKVSTEKETSVDAIDAVWATVMMNEIDEAQNSDSGNKK